MPAILKEKSHRLKWFVSVCMDAFYTQCFGGVAFWFPAGFILYGLSNSYTVTRSLILPALNVPC